MRSPPGHPRLPGAAASRTVQPVMVTVLVVEDEDVLFQAIERVPEKLTHRA